MNVKAVLALSSVALAGFASFVGVSGSLFPVSAAGSVNPLYDYYFDSIRADTERYWSRLVSVDLTQYGMDSPYLDVSFTIPASTPFPSSRAYCFRLCSDPGGSVYLYYRQAPSQGTVGICDFALTFDDNGNGRDVYWFYQNRFSGYAGSPFVSYTVTQDSSRVSVTTSDYDVIVAETTSMNVLSSSITFSGLWVATYNNENAGQAYSEGYDNGKYDGNSEGYASGYAEGRSDGVASGYSGGYADGYSAGDSAGYASGVVDGAAMGETTVVDIWPLLSAVLTMPFTFFSQNWNATLFSGTPFEFNLSLFLSSVLILLFVWKIITMVVGFTK